MSWAVLDGVDRNSYKQPLQPSDGRAVIQRVREEKDSDRGSEGCARSVTRRPRDGWEGVRAADVRSCGRCRGAGCDRRCGPTGHRSACNASGSGLRGAMLSRPRGTSLAARSTSPIAARTLQRFSPQIAHSASPRQQAAHPPEASAVVTPQ